MHFYTYKITNLINGKIYVGVHKTENLDDGYMGSGLHLKRAKEKYGIENFNKEILMIHESQEDMFEMEELIVDQEFIDRKDTYNLKLGGQGGWDHINSDIDLLRNCRAKQLKIFMDKIKTDKEFREKFSKSTSIAGKRLWSNPEYKEKMLRVFTFDWTGRTHSLESKSKMSETHRKNNHQKGSKNSQFGKMWIHSPKEKRSTRINKTEPIPLGWQKGRMTFTK